MEYVVLAYLIRLIVFGVLALGCLIMLFSLCFRKSKCVRRIDFFGIMMVELLAAFILLSLLPIGTLRVRFYIFVLLIPLNVVLAVIYLRKVSKANREMKKNGSDTIA